MPNKKRLAFYAGSGCGGCSQSLMLSPSLATMLDGADIAFWATRSGDLTEDEISQLDDKGIDVLMFAGPVDGEASIATAKLLRRKAKRVVAYGACAHLGGLCGLTNVIPGAKLRELAERNGGFIKPLSAVIEVDYVLPGCPPPQGMVERMVKELFLADDVPDVGTVFASSKGVCAQCERKHLNNPLEEIRRFHAAPPDPDICLLDQGYICLGPVTRGGCGAVCLEANRPCTGCAGPVAGVLDQGGAILQSLASLVPLSGDISGEKEHRVLDSIQDIVGTAYKYSAAASLLKRRVNDGE